MSGENPNDPYPPPSGDHVPLPPPAPPLPSTPYGSGAPWYQPPSPQYSVGDAFSYGWKKFRGSCASWVLATLMFGVVVAAMYIAQNLLLELAFPTAMYSYDAGANARAYSVSGAQLAAQLVLWFGSAWVVLVLVWTCGAQLVRGGLENTKVGRVSLGAFAKTRQLGSVMIAAVVLAPVYMVLTGFGLMACIIPGLVLAFLFWSFTMFIPFFIVDRGESAFRGIGSGFSFASRNFSKVLVLELLSLAVLLVGLLLVGIGLLVAVPVVFLAQAYTYRVLSGQPVAA